MNTFKKIYKLSEIKYPWLLALSMILFIVALCFNRFYPVEYTNVEVYVYGADMALAFLWSILNYMANLKIRDIYKRHDDIDEFVKRLSMSTDDKEELIQYLNDFAKDLEQNGLTREEAMKTAISHFQAKEFSSASQSDIFEKPSHLYLFGYASIFIATAIPLILFTGSLFGGAFWLHATYFALGLYGVALFCLFFVYKLIDMIIAKK